MLINGLGQLPPFDIALPGTVVQRSDASATKKNGRKKVNINRSIFFIASTAKAFRSPSTADNLLSFKMP